MGVEAFWSSKFVASNAASVQRLLPPPVVVDLIFRDGGVSSFTRRTSKVARVASRGWNMLKSLKHRTRSNSVPFVAPLLEPPPRNSQSFICRVNSSDSASECEDSSDEDNSLGDHEQKPETVTVSVKYGDRFRRTASPDFSDEFFTRMMALEASHNESPRGDKFCLSSTVASLDAAGADGASEPSDDGGGGQSDSGPLCALSGVAGMQLPSSIRRLRRRTSDVKGDSSRVTTSSSGCAIQNAFSSMVYMIKVVQSHALQIRQVLFSEWDVQEVLHLVHREMHSSFVWLFQQVFACTPTLMVSVMILLANFTVYSMGENVALATVTDTPPQISLFLSTYKNPQPTYSIPLSHHHHHHQSFSSPQLDVDAGSGGNNVNSPSPSTADAFDGDSYLNNTRRYLLSQKDHNFPRLGASQFRRADVPPTKEKTMKAQRDEQHELMKAWVARSMKDLSGDDDHVVQLEQETIRRLVAPVVAHLESDNYACFDRTDLEYQHALSKDPRNSLLLANYAQFLYVVRHDNDRAEGYFHQAMQVDPLDSTILGRFASFLWLCRGNRAAAERAYKAAMAADPENSFPAGNYAHFLWHAGDGDNSHGARTL